MPRDFEGWLGLLDSDNDEARLEAIEHFLKNPDERAIEPLVAVAIDPRCFEDEQYRAAEAALGALGEEAYVERFTRVFRSSEGDQRRLALSALAEWAIEAARPIFLEALEAEDPSVIALAVEALGLFEELSLAETLRPFVDHDDTAVRRSALQAMSRLESVFAAQRAIDALASADAEQRFDAAMQLADDPSKDAVEPLIARLQDSSESPKVRRKAGEALGATRDGRAFDAVLAALDDEDDSVRATAARELGHFEDPRVIGPLSEYLHAWGDGGRAHSQAAVGLRILGHPDAIPTLLEALEDDREAVRQWSSEALGKLEPPPKLRPKVIAGLEVRLGDPSETVRTYALRALGALEANEAAEAIAEFLHSEHREERWRAVEALGNLGATQYADAIAALSDDHRFVKSAVAAALGKMGRPKHMSTLIAMLEEVPRQAAHALAELGEPGAIDALVERADALNAPAEEYDRLELWAAAARLGHAESRDRLAKILRGGGENAPDAAIALVAAGDERGLDECCRQTESRYRSVRLDAIWALGEYGGEAALPALQRALENPDASVRTMAKEALAKLAGDP